MKKYSFKIFVGIGMLMLTFQLSAQDVNFNIDPKQKEIFQIKFFIEEMAGRFADNNIDDYVGHWTCPCSYQFDGGIALFESDSAFGEFIADFRSTLPATYNRSMITDFDIKVIGENLAYASVMWVRIMDGRPTQYFGDLYTLVKKDRWRVIQASAYDGPDLMRIN